MKYFFAAAAAACVFASLGVASANSDLMSTDDTTFGAPPNDDWVQDPNSPMGPKFKQMKLTNIGRAVRTIEMKGVNVFLKDKPCSMKLDIDANGNLVRAEFFGVVQKQQITRGGWLPATKFDSIDNGGVHVMEAQNQVPYFYRLFTKRDGGPTYKAWAMDTDNDMQARHMVHTKMPEGRMTTLIELSWNSKGLWLAKGRTEILAMGLFTSYAIDFNCTDRQQ